MPFKNVLTVAAKAVIWGLEGSLNDGLIKFKANFNPTINEFIGEFDLPVNKLLFKASEYAYKLRKQNNNTGLKSNLILVPVFSIVLRCIPFH